MSLQRKVQKPRSQRGKRFLKNREPKLFENTKSVLAIRTNTASELVVRILKDLSALKKPDSSFLGRKHELRPFENEQLLEKFSSQHDASLLITGSHNKKRPTCVTFVRTFDHHILDMFEFSVENYKGIADFPGISPPLGNKPLLIFRGEAFEHDPVFRAIKSVFIDYFRGPIVDKIRPAGVSHAITFVTNGERIFMRTFMLNGTEESDETSTKPKETTLTPMGPSMDFVPNRSKVASEDLWKAACRVPRETKIKKTKNVSQDVFGSKLGRIHMETQDFTRLNVKKMKGLRSDAKSKNANESEPMDVDNKTPETVDYTDIGGDLD
ncbi:ribosome production factor 2 homolog [Paramacrobiotus metropolitanus]|uniref:ribosome production factor 2 homolog n=1 Tax=Paramacrobiotus metropolitanus TaxID=2943436 RepID=UPI0024463325|nr:ribosome production factor 2 homolog [Paramacrobiotus metropolitanus]